MNDAGDWLIGTAKRNPEALLVLAAGCALLMRRAGSAFQTSAPGPSGASAANSAWDVSRARDKGAEVVGEVRDRIVDAASSVSEQASQVAKTLSSHSSQFAGQAQSMLSSSFGQLLREQPMALVAVGLAAGAAVAAMLPATEVEERTLGSARDAISGMAGKVGENLIAAATDAGQRLTQGMTERATEGIKELAQDVAGQITDKVIGATGKPGDRPANAPSSPAPSPSPLPNRGT